jgi:excisionase family DNA binding protein
MQSLNIEKELVTITQAAKILSVHPNTIRNLISRGDLRAERIGSRLVRIHRDDLIALFHPYDS